MKKLTALLVLVSLIMLGCSKSEEKDSVATGEKETGKPEIVLRYAETNAAGDERAIAAMEFAELIKERTNGRISIQVFPGGQLGSQSDVFKSVQLGAIDMCNFVPAQLPKLGINVPYLQVLSIPFMYRDQDHALDVMHSEIGDKIRDDINNANGKIRLVDFFVAGPRNFYTKSAVDVLEDFKGLKIRVQADPVYMEMVTTFGGSPTPIDYSEVYSALQTGLVDGAENPVKGYFNNKHYEVAPHYIYSNHVIEASAMFISEMTWNKLSDADKELFTKTAEEITANFQTLTKSKTADQVKQLEEAGVQFHTLQDYDKWVEAAQPLFDKYGEGYEDLIKSIQSK